MKTVQIIIPVYNEEDNIKNFIVECNKIIENIKDISFSYCFINDGSMDNTRAIILEEIKSHDNVSLINFSKNFGKEQAMMSGIQNCLSDACIIMDVDLQNPVHLIKDFISLWQSGHHMVYGVAQNRSKDGFIKRNTAILFYKFYNLISGLKIPQNAGDFRLLDKKIIKEISKIKDKNLFMKGIYHSVGFTSTSVEYNRETRHQGETKFNFFKLLKLALDGIFNFTALPLRVSSFLGSVIAFISFIWGMKIVFSKLFFGSPIPGYPSLMVAILFLFGLQFLFIGLLGEYISRIFDEVKSIPNYVISEHITKDNVKDHIDD